MKRTRKLDIWDYTVFAGIVLASIAAGVVLYKSGTKASIDFAHDKGFDVAAGAVGLLIVIYAVRDWVSGFTSARRPDNKTFSDALPPHIRAFVAGGFTVIFFQSLVQGVWQFVASAIDGTFEWLVLAVSFAVGGLGVALGVGLLAGSARALRWVRVLLVLGIAGGCLDWILAMLHIGPVIGARGSASVIVSLALLILLAWPKRWLVKGKDEV